MTTISDFLTPLSRPIPATEVEFNHSTYVYSTLIQLVQLQEAKLFFFATQVRLYIYIFLSNILFSMAIATKKMIDLLGVRQAPPRC